MSHFYQLDGVHEFEESAEVAPLPKSSMFLRTNLLAEAEANYQASVTQAHEANHARAQSNASAISRIDVTSPISVNSKPFATKKEARNIYYGNTGPSSNSGDDSDLCEVVASNRTNEFKYGLSD